MQGITVFQLAKFKNASGNLVVAESGKDINFVSKRIFFITANKGDVRGQHAHREHSQFMICVKGACSIKFDDGFRKQDILLDSNDKGVEVKPGVWGEQKYLNDNTILLVLSDFLYDENDYIRDYQEFLRYIQGHKK